ncbi:MAG TPA: hypothetical protein VIH35_02525 [Kiritimatiellia bacterium]|jgi:hypothetical protein
MKTARLASLLLAATLFSSQPVHANGVPYTDRFDDCTFTHRGRSDYFLPLLPGVYAVLAGTEIDDGEEETTVVYMRIMNGTRVVNGVRCAILREMEWINDELVEVSYNYFALCKETKAVMYFGEDVDIYEDGEVVSHDGAWLAGKNGARAGLIMPGQALIGSRYFQEIAEGVALDRAEHLDNETTIQTPVGTFQNCLYVAETTPLEPGHVSFKAYAKHIGMVLDGHIRLTEFGQSARDIPPVEEEEGD